MLLFYFNALLEEPPDLLRMCYLVGQCILKEAMMS